MTPATVLRSEQVNIGCKTRLEERVAERTRELETANNTLRQTQLAIMQHERLRRSDRWPAALRTISTTRCRRRHRVTVADVGQAGIDTFLAATGRGESFSMVISDLGMPHIDGRRVAAAVKAASPKTPIVLLTGWSYSMREDGDLPAHVDHLLSKPPDVNELRLAISKLTAEAET